MDIPLDHVRFFNDNGSTYPVLALEAFPEVATRISVFLATFAVAELATRDLLAKAIGVSQEEAHDILAHFQSQSLRAKLVESLSSTNPDTPIKARIRDLLSELRWLTKERNKYAHAQYGVPQDNSDRRLFRVTYLTDQKKTDWSEVSIPSVDADILRAKALITTLWELLRT